ncbi:hypothetical protein BDSB_24515 [Burkholderia dolosa PC543]|nr:hypothetical protein BDSB_24515 [Burkholderia dolosa PC543]
MRRSFGDRTRAFGVAASVSQLEEVLVSVKALTLGCSRFGAFVVRM